MGGWTHGGRGGFLIVLEMLVSVVVVRFYYL